MVYASTSLFCFVLYTLDDMYCVYVHVPLESAPACKYYTACRAAAAATCAHRAAVLMAHSMA